MSTSRSAIWEAETLRLTCFFDATDPSGLPGPGMWAARLGDEPTLSEKKPKEASWREVGEFADAELTLQLAGSRFDWVLSPASAVPSIEQMLARLGPYPSAAGRLLSVWSEWLRSLDTPMLRLAFGAVLVADVADRRQGYETLAGYLPQLTIDPDGSSDLIYQINRPRPSKVISGLMLNRLSHWSVSQMVQIVFQAGGVVQTPLPATHLCRLTLDLNTIPTNNNEKLPQARLVPLLEELQGFALEIAQNGDIP